MPYIDVRLLFREESDWENQLRFYGVAIADTDLSLEDLAFQGGVLAHSGEDLTEMVCGLMDSESKE